MFKTLSQKFLGHFILVLVVLPTNIQYSATVMLIRPVKTFMVSLVLLHSTTSTLDRIVGGRKSAIQDFPYQLSLRYNGEPLCGAVIISKDVCLTAAHCIVHKGSYSVRAGSTYIYEGGDIIYVKEVIVHPQHTKGNQDFDIAILKLSHPFRYSNNIKPVKLPNPYEEVPQGIQGNITGWGSFSSYFSTVSDELRAVAVPVFDKKLCVDIYKSTARITSRMFCAGYRAGGKDSCQGDSGGPFVVNGILYGLVSWGINCAQPGYPGVYTKISYLRDYIKKNCGV